MEYDVDNDEIVRDQNGRCQLVAEGEPGLLLGKITPDTVFEGYTDSEATEKKVIRDAFADGAPSANASRMTFFSVASESV